MNDLDVSTTVLVTFVGGPLHGTQRLMTALEPTFWQVIPSGGAVMYERRIVGDSDALRIGGIVYSPVGLSENAFQDLSRSWKPIPGNL